MFYLTITLMIRVTTDLVPSRFLTYNPLNDFVKTDVQISNPVSTAADQTEKQKQEEFEDELEEGGLC